MLHHIKVDYQPTTDTSYHTSTAFTPGAAITEFNRLRNLWPDRFISVVRYQPHPEFVTSNDASLNSAFKAKRSANHVPVIDWTETAEAQS